MYIYYIMTRTQIQFPDPLYKRLKAIAKPQDWSLAEVLRKAAEHFVTRFPELDRIRKGFLETSVF
ncbi:MAG: putative transcriptional regulator [Verrucomicrobiales bacterium]|jgi:predicted transcriptional regulator